MYMIVFAVLVAGSFFIALAARNMPLQRLSDLGRPIPNPIGFILPAIGFSLFSGFRNNLGDTFFYIYEYKLMKPETMEIHPLQFESGGLYAYLLQECRLRFEEPYVLLVITATLACAPAIYALYKYCHPFELGVAFFVLTSYYTFSMNGIRQYAAAGVLLLGTKYLLSDKWIDFLKYLPFVGVAWLFHASALLMIPIYFIVRRKAWTPFTTVLLGGTIFLTLIFDSVLQTFLGVLEETSYSNYAQNGWFEQGTETGSNVIRVIVLAVPLVLAYLNREKLTHMYGRKWDILVNLSILNLAFYILSLYNWIFARLAIYTSVYVIMMMANVIYEGVPKGDSKMYYSASLVLYSAYFYFVRYSIEDYSSDLF